MASGRLKILPNLSLCNGNNETTEMYMKKTLKKTDKYSYNNVLKSLSLNSKGDNFRI